MQSDKAITGDMSTVIGESDYQYAKVDPEFGDFLRKNEYLKMSFPLVI